MTSAAVAADATYAPPEPARKRVDSVDLLRGIVMIIMVLDHTRDYFHHDALAFDPTNLERTTPILFLTRWITHYCAPIFVFLAGTGAYLQLARGKSKRELSRFLVTRGLWLILLEITVVKLLAFGTVSPSIWVLQVIWAIGVSMIVLAGLIHLRVRTVAILAVAMILLHNLLDPIRIPFWLGPGTPAPDAVGKLWMILHQSGPIPLGESVPPVVMLVLYPLIPWIGVLAAGYALGRVYDWDAETRRRWLLRAGAIVVVGWTILRALNVYGDPRPWAVQGTPVFTALSFLNVQKYPPSLLFLAMTLGPALLALAWFERRQRSLAMRGANGGSGGRLWNAVLVVGRVPLFFYLMQWAVPHGLSMLVNAIAGKPNANFLAPPGSPALENFGWPLWAVYLAWLTSLAIIYPFCRWYAGVKARSRNALFSYL